jgi:hypothetical protein
MYHRHKILDLTYMYASRKKCCKVICDYMERPV